MWWKKGTNTWIKPWPPWPNQYCGNPNVHKLLETTPHIAIYFHKWLGLEPQTNHESLTSGKIRSKPVWPLWLRLDLPVLQTLAQADPPAHTAIIKKLTGRSSRMGICCFPMFFPLMKCTGCQDVTHEMNCKLYWHPWFTWLFCVEFRESTVFLLVYDWHEMYRCKLTTGSSNRNRIWKWETSWLQCFISKGWMTLFANPFPVGWLCSRCRRK